MPASLSDTVHAGINVDHTDAGISSLLVKTALLVSFLVKTVFLGISGGLGLFLLGEKTVLSCFGLFCPF